MGTNGFDMRRIVLFLVCFLFAFQGIAKTYKDSPGENLIRLMQHEGAKYIISYHHTFRDTLFIPKNCELLFDGGSLVGPIVLNNTELTGKVNLKGASLSGSVSNKVFESDWLCETDGISDEALHINQMIEVCGNVHFSAGKYRLVSAFNPKSVLGKNYQASIKAHIGIFKSDVSLIGEEGTEFITSDHLGIICVFSKPNQIENSVKNITINNIVFTTKNDGKEFYEFVHVIKLIGVNGMSIKKCFFNDFWGDAIALSHYGDTPKTGERTLNQNVIIDDNIIIGGEHHNNRNGISVVSGKNVLIKRNSIKNTSRDDMPGGIDIEPNNSAYTVENIRIVGNNIEGCRGTVGAIGVVMLNEGAPGHNITIESNFIKNCSNGIAVALKTRGSTSHFIIRNNIVDEDTRPYKFVFNGQSVHWIISGNVFLQPCKQSIPGRIKVENLTVKNNVIRSF